MKKYFRFIPGWEWFVLLAVLVVLALFVLGQDLLGLNGLMSSAVALAGAAVTTLAAFIMVALIGPLLALCSALVVALMSLVGLLVSTLVVPVVGFAAGLFGMVATWLAGTWVGVMLSPVYGLVAPIMLK